MTVCSDDGSCYISFKDAAFNVAFTAFYGIYFIKVAQSLSEVNIFKIYYAVDTCLTERKDNVGQLGERSFQNPKRTRTKVKPVVHWQRMDKHKHNIRIRKSGQYKLKHKH